MSTRSSQADDITMSGGGLYSLATVGAKHVIDAAGDLVVDAIDAMELRVAGRPFTITDMGCADGGTSLNMIRRAIEKVRSQNATRPIQIVYADQPRNDYNALVSIVYGLTDFDSYLGAYPEVYVQASGTSFYRQILPANTVDLGFSATAMHWLSRKPGHISDHVQAVGASGAELEAFQRQGREDWKTILCHRANEIVSGGKLVLVNFARDEAGRYLGNTGGINMFDTFNDIWRRFVDDGVVTLDEYVNMTLPQYYNTVEEFRAPFDDKNNPVSKAGLRLEHIETRVVPCPFATDFKQHGDATKFAAAYIPTIRTWNESTYFGALDTSRPLDERKDIIERYYGTYESMVAENPEGHGMDYVHAYMVIAKE